MEGERLPRGQPSHRRPQRLRDISYLYLSGRASARDRVAPAPRLTLRVGFVSEGDGRIKSDVCSNFAVQLARLGQRTLVLDLDPALPNAGFALGLEPGAYAAHLHGATPRVERALLGLRVVEGIAGHGTFELTETLQQELDRSDCVLVNFPDLRADAEATLLRLRTVLGRTRETTVAQAAAHSPMFNAWFETAHRGKAAPVASPGRTLDALVLVHAGATLAGVGARFKALQPWLGPGRLHLLGWGEGAKPAQPQPWAWITSYAPLAQGRTPLSSILPEHPAARTYEGLVQSLLAGHGSRGGPDA